jgi:hypothetical protein
VDASDVRSGDPTVTIGVRVAALAAAVFWAVLFYGLIDLLIDYSRIAGESLDHGTYLLAIGWGLLYTVTVPGPLVLFAFSGARVFLQQLFVTGAGILLCAVLSLAIGQLVPGLLLLGMTAGLTSASRMNLRPDAWRFVRRIDWLLGSLVLVAVTAAVTYAAQMVLAIGEAADDVSWSLHHLPMQAAFGVAIAGSAAVSTLAGAARERGWRAAAVPPAVSATWFGAASVLHPEQVGSWGITGGWVAVGWGVLFVTCSATRGRTPPQRAHP